MPKGRRNRFKAVLESDYRQDIADAIAKALQADNISTPETSIVTSRKGGRVTSRLESASLEKLLPVLDDLLFCQSLCEKTLILADDSLKSDRGINRDVPEGRA